MSRYTPDPDLDPDLDLVNEDGPDGDGRPEATYEDDHPEPPTDDGDPDGEVADLEQETTEDDGSSKEGTDAGGAGEFGHGDIEDQVRAEAEARSEVPVPRWTRIGDLLLEYKFWTNPRTFTGLDEVAIQALANDILAKSSTTETAVVAGIQEPLLVVQIRGANGDIDELVLDGQRRLRAAHVAKLGDDALVLVRDREPEPIEWSQAVSRKYLKEVLTVVGLRRDLSAYELSEAAQHLRGAKDLDSGKELTLAQIAAAIGRSESWVSKILTARTSASPKLLHRWKRGEISEEQFRDLATGIKAPEEQDKAAAEVTETRKSGDKGEARRNVKEQKERARIADKEKRDSVKKAKADAKAKAKADRAAAKASKKEKGKKPAVMGPQADLPIAAAPKPAAPTPPKPKTMSPAIVEDLLEQARRKPPTHELVKGIILGIQAGTGRLDTGDLPKPWHTYIHHLSGTKPEKSKTRR